MFPQEADEHRHLDEVVARWVADRPQATTADVEAAGWLEALEDPLAAVVVHERLAALADPAAAAALADDALPLAAHAVGLALALQGRGRTYARERHAFGRPIGTFQVQRHRLAEVTTRITAARALLRRAAVGLAPLGAACRTAARLAPWVADEVLQLHGGFGYAEESGLGERWMYAHAVAERLLGAVPVGDLPRAAIPWDAPYADHRARLRGFVDRAIRPHKDAWEAAGDYPRELFREAAAAGLFGAKFPPELGGTGPDYLAAAIVWEELARLGADGIGADLGAHADLATLYVARGGTPELVDRWVRPSLQGAVIGALAITEPDAGSDVAGIRTRAKVDGDGWVLNGTKVFITNGAWADYLVVAAQAGEGHGGVTLFCVDASLPGVAQRRLRMMGWHTSHTGEIALEGVRVGAADVVGGVGGGFIAIMENFAWERIGMSLGAVVLADTALAAVPSPDPDLAAQVEAARALGYLALDRVVAGGIDASAPAPDAAVVAAQAKLASQRLALRCAIEAWRAGVPAADRWMRDARLGPIGGGTDEIMRDIIGRSLGF